MEAINPNQPNRFKALIKKGLANSTEEKLLEILTESIAEMLQKEPDLLLSSLYRMDVSEQRVEEVLDGLKGDNIAAGIAELVLERQKTSIETRANHPQPKIDDDEASL